MTHWLITALFAALITTSTLVTGVSAQELGKESSSVCERASSEGTVGCHGKLVADDVQQWADWIGVDPLEFQGAVTSTGLSPEAYAISAGLIVAPSPRERLYRDYPASAARMDCIISKESQWQDVMNRQGSGAGGPGQYMQGTWDRHVLELRVNGQVAWDRDMSRHSFDDVFAVMNYDLSLGRRGQWEVGGC